MDALFLDSKHSSQKSRHFLAALQRSAAKLGINTQIDTKYRPCDMLVVYGLGGDDRYPAGMQHMHMGKPLLSFDLGYWDRKLPFRKYRFSLNGMHPRHVMQGPEPLSDRWDQSGLTIKSLPVKTGGPIMLVGNAPKSIAIGARGWTGQKSAQIRKEFPCKQIVYRPKPKRPVEKGVSYDSTSTAQIDKALANVSLVVCRHSNVAVDACRLGIPVVCDDGAAASIYPSALANYQQQPDLETRTRFLRRLAYWQWSKDETDLFWNWFFGTFPEYAIPADR